MCSFCVHGRGYGEVEESCLQDKSLNLSQQLYNSKIQKVFRAKMKNTLIYILLYDELQVK